MVTFQGNPVSVGDILRSKGHRSIAFRVRWIREEEGMIDLVNVDPKEWSDGQYIISRLEENFDRHEMHPATITTNACGTVMLAKKRNDVLPVQEQEPRDRDFLHRMLDYYLDSFVRKEGDVISLSLTHHVIQQEEAK